jgi:hypothetical protein
MGEKAIFQNAFPYGDDVLALPVADVESAATWYAQHFAMVEAERKSTPQPTVIMERDGVRIGFSVNGAIARKKVRQSGERHPRGTGGTREQGRENRRLACR